MNTTYTMRFEYYVMVFYLIQFFKIMFMSFGILPSRLRF